MSAPLEGIRVIELAAMIAVPAATHTLASYGADVIKVEEVGGSDLVRALGSQKNGMSAWFANVNSGKRAVAVDLKTDPGREVLWRLIESADVFVEGFRDGVTEALGFGYGAVAERAPNIVYCASSGFGPVGPYGGQPAFDSLIQAMAGWGEVQPHDGKPQLIKNMLADKTSAINNAQSIMAALIRRGRTGEGAYIRNSMLEASVRFLWPDGMMHCTLLDDDAMHMPNILATYRLYGCTDGWVSIAAPTDKQWRGLCAALDRGDLAADARYATAATRSENMVAWFEAIDEAVSRFSLDEVLRRLREAEVPVAPLVPLEDVAQHEQVVAMGIMETAEHPDMGRYLRPRSPAWAMGEPVAMSPAPGHGQHTAEVLGELGYSDDEITQFARQRCIKL
jgi:crotonobetainyl-CoA:carnitine CoA-transferase CaiB-like acyl-CoA transferase